MCRKSLTIELTVHPGLVMVKYPESKQVNAFNDYYMINSDLKTTHTFSLKQWNEFCVREKIINAIIKKLIRTDVEYSLGYDVGEDECKIPKIRAKDFSVQTVPWYEIIFIKKEGK